MSLNTGKNILQQLPPTVLHVLDALILISQSGDDNEKLDFTLADDVTDYVICVSFDSKGQVIDISMES